MKLADLVANYSYGTLNQTYDMLKFTIPTHLRRRRQLFCKLLRERGVTSHKGQWVVVVMRAHPHPWRVIKGGWDIETRFKLWVKEHAYQVLTPKQIDSILKDDPTLELYALNHFLEVNFGD